MNQRDFYTNKEQRFQNPDPRYMYVNQSAYPRPPNYSYSPKQIPTSQKQYQMTTQTNSSISGFIKNYGYFEGLLNYLETTYQANLPELRTFLQANNKNHLYEQAISNIIDYSQSKLPYMSILKRGMSGSFDLSSKECATLVARMFLGMTQKSSSSHLNRDQDFKRLFEADIHNSKQEKIQMIFDYFLNVPNKSNRISFKRVVANKILNLMSLCSNQRPLCPVTLLDRGYIEDNTDAAWVDFANKYIGGGVLGSGFLQEEKLFMEHPEVLVSLLTCEKLEDGEALIIQSNEGYEIIAIDALDFSKTGSSTQYTLDSIERELNKALVGFSGAKNKKIATGKWGCGAFKGDSELKFMIQWLAMSLLGKEMIYCAAGDKTVYSEVENIINQMRFKTIGDLADRVSNQFLKKNVNSFLPFGEKSSNFQGKKTVVSSPYKKSNTWQATKEDYQKRSNMETNYLNKNSFQSSPSGYYKKPERSNYSKYY